MEILDWKGESAGRSWWLRALAFALVLGIILGVLGPFGSFLNGDMSLRILSWTVNVMAGTVIIGGLAPPLTRLAMRAGLPRLPSLGMALVILAVPVAVFSAVFGHWLWPRAVATVRPIDWYVQALVMAIVFIVVWVLFELARQTVQRPVRAPLQDKPAPSLIGAEPVLCLQMEDHYVRIHRRSGSTLELMPMRDAIARYAGEGLQVHRGWWVSTTAVTAAERDARNWRLRLVNGLSVPVARNRLTAVRTQGWIAEAE